MQHRFTGQSIFTQDKDGALPGTMCSLRVCGPSPLARSRQDISKARAFHLQTTEALRSLFEHTPFEAFLLSFQPAQKQPLHFPFCFGRTAARRWARVCGREVHLASGPRGLAASVACITRISNRARSA